MVRYLVYDNSGLIKNYIGEVIFFPFLYSFTHINKDLKRSKVLQDVSRNSYHHGDE